MTAHSSWEPSRGHAAPPSSGASYLRRAERYRARKDLKQILGDGTKWRANELIRPFVFRAPDDAPRIARSAGLEGFLHTKLEIERDLGDAALIGQVDDFFRYLDVLLSPVPLAAPLRRELAGLSAALLPAEEISRRLNELLIRSVRELRGHLEALDESAWGRSAVVYMILARAYNRPKPGLGFFESLDAAELDRIRRETHANVIWLLDVFEIGETRRWGSGGGSPYSIVGYRVKAELGGDAAMKRFVDRAHHAGLRVMTDFIPNHTALDSDLVRERPELALHIVPPPGLDDEEIMAGVPREAHAPHAPVYYLVEAPRGGGRRILVHHPRTDFGEDTWIDMAQLDYSRPEVRAWQIEQALRLFDELGIDGIRRDMSYEQVEARFFERWLRILDSEKRSAGVAPWARHETDRLITELRARRRALEGREFWEEFNDALKSRFGHAFAIDEAYACTTELSRAGSDGVYNKNDHDVGMGQRGLYDAMVSRDPEAIREALRHVAFRAWQRGGAAMVNFVGTHDAGEGNPVDRFGPMFRAAAATALLLRPVLVYNGLEQGVGQARNIIADRERSSDLAKAIPFDVRAVIDWREEDPENRAFVRMILAKGEEHRDLLARGAMTVHEPCAPTPIVAWSIGRRDPSDGAQRALLVAANFSEQRACGRFRVTRPVLGPFGAFEPRADRLYMLRDCAAPGAGEASGRHARAGAQLLEDGLFIRLEGGQVHIFEIEEVEY
uniref:Alpha amylase catalytic region n=1 Tax=Phaselicystis flava TaxID=525924 RepID=A0A3S5GYG4_9BACT|nr:alpha amylase catalytic region [Phaselicystis flava]